MKYEDDDRLNCIDGLKGLGAFVIAFVWHYHQFDPQNGMPFANLFGLSYVFGWSMVDLFFILSGFGIMIGYGRRIVEKRTCFCDYILRRFRRLYPTFLISTFTVLILEVLYKYRAGKTFMYPNFDIYHLIRNLLLLQNGILGTDFSLNAPSWCISISMVCYCLFYLVLSRVREVRHAVYCFCFMFMLGVAIIASEISAPVFNSQMGRGLAGFSIGVVLAVLYENRDKCIRIPMINEARSLNLSNSVAVVVYEALRQTGFSGLKNFGELHNLSWNE